MKTALVLAMLIWPQVPWAGPLSDVILAPGAFRATAPGQVTRYDEGAGGQIVVRSVDQGAALAMDVVGPEGVRPIAEFPAGGADPVLLYFLESLTREVAEATGGSPHYIRNRLRDALGRAGLGEPTLGLDGRAVTEAALQPFAEDANRDRLGPFADLTLRFQIAKGQPVQLVMLSARTSSDTDAYERMLTLNMKDD